jgi:hypothetical protein
MKQLVLRKDKKNKLVITPLVSNANSKKGGECWTECDAIGGFIMYPYSHHCVRYCAV